MHEGWNSTIERYLDESLREDEPEAIILEAGVSEPGESESILKQAKKVTAQESGKKIVIEKTVTQADVNKAKK